MSDIIDIIKIKVESEINTKHFRIDFNYKGEQEKKVSVKIYETFFNLGYRVIGGEINLVKGINYWAADTFNNGLIYRLNNDIKICFHDIDDDNNILYEEIINIGNQNIEQRSRGGDMSRKNIWFIGDSNLYHYFSKYNFNSDEFFFNDKVLMTIDIPELSINRFINSKYLEFIKTLPLFNKDIVILNLGEIDCRVSFYRNAKLKNRTLIDHINNVLERYVNTIKNIKQSIYNIELVICLPHPPLRDGWVKDHDINHLLNESTEKDRYFIREYVNRILIDKLNEINIKYINPFTLLEDEQGFINNEYLLPFDNHTKDNELVLNEIKKLI